MPNELGIKVKVNLDTSEQALRDQMKGVQSYFDKDPVKIAFAPDKTKTRSNINQVLRDMTSGKEGVQVTVPEITLKFKVNGKEVGTQIKAALEQVTNGTFGGGSKSNKNITSNLKKQLDEIVKEYSNMQKRVSSLSKAQLGVDQDSDYYKELQRQIEETKKSYASLRAEFAKEFPNSIEELAKQEEKLNKAFKDKQTLDALKQQYNQLNANASAYDSAAVKMERLTAQIDYQKKLLESYKEVGVDTSYANTLIQGFEKFNTGDAGKGLDDATKLRALQDAATSLNAEMGRLAKQHSNLTTKQQDVARSANNLAGELTRILQDNPRIRENTELYNSFVDVINRLNHVDVKDQQGFAKLQLRASSLKSEFIQLGLNTDTLYTKLSHLFTEHFQTALVMAGIHGIQQGLQEVIANVSNLDHALVELRKVTDETENTYNRFLDSAAVKARELGTSIADYTESAAEWAQGGYTFEEADQLAYVATLYKNVGDGIDSAAQSSEYLISILRGFGLQAEDALSVVDKINEVSNKTAISAQGLGEALTRSAAALSSAGNDLDESLALAAGANSIIQDPDRVGNGLRSIALFLRAAKTEAEELNIDTEGMASSVSELREDVMAIAGVDIMADEAGTQFKSTIDILRELSEVWDSLSDIDQANLTEMLIGKHQANIFVGLMQSMEDVETAYSAALDSVGSASEENEKYLDSIAGKTAQLTAAFEQLSNTLLNSDVIKFFLDLGIGATDAANALAELTGVLPILATGLSSAGLFKSGMAGGLSAFATLNKDLANIKNAASQMAAVSKAGREFASIFQGLFNGKVILDSSGAVTDFTNSLAKLTEQEQLAALSFVKFDGGSKEATKSLIEQASATLGLSSATVGATTAQQAFNIALGVGKTLLTGLGIGVAVFAIQKIGEAIYNAVNAAEIANEKMEESSNKLQEMSTNVDTLEEKLKNTSKQIADLQSKGALSITDQEELDNLERENALLEAQVALEREKLAVQAEKSRQDTNDAIKETDDDHGTLGVTREDVEEGISIASQNIAGSGLVDSEQLNILIAGYNELNRLIKETEDPDQVVAYNQELTATKEKILEIVDSLQSQRQSLENLGKENWTEKERKEFEELNTTIETVLSYLNRDYYFNILFNKKDIESGKKELQEMVQRSGISATDLTVLLGTEDMSSNVDAFVATFTENGYTIANVAEGIVNSIESIGTATGDISPELTEMNAKLDEVQGAYQTVRGAIDEYNQYGLLSADTLQTLSTLSPEYTKCLFDENGQLVINQGTLANTRQSYAALAESIYKAIQALQIKNAIDKIENTSSALEAANNYDRVESLDELTEKYGDFSVLQQAAADAMNEWEAEGGSDYYLKDAAAWINQLLDGVKQSNEAIDAQIDKLYEDTDASLNYSAAQKGAGKAASDAANQIHDALGAWADLYAAMDEYNTYGEISYQTLNGLLQSWPELTQCLVENEGKLTINTEALKNLIEQQLALTVADEDATNTTEELGRMLNWLKDEVDDDTISLDELMDKIEGVGTAMDKAQGKGQNYASGLSTAFEQVMTYDPQNQGIFSNDTLSAIADMEQELKGFSDEALVSLNPDTNEIILNYDAIKKATVQYIRDIAETAASEGDAVASQLYTATADAIEAGDQSAIEWWTKLGQTLEYVSSAADTFQADYKTLDSISKEYNSQGQISLDSMQSLMAIAPEHLKYLTLEGNKLVFNKDAYVEYYKQELNVIKAKAIANGATKEQIAWMDELIDGLKDSDYWFGVTTDSMENYKNALTKLGDVFDAVLNLIDKGLDAAQDNLQDAADNLQIIGDAIINEIDDRIDALEDQKDALEDFYDDQIGNLEDLKDAQDDANEELERAIELAKLQDALARAKANRTVRKYVEGQGYIWTVDEDAVHDAEQELSDQLREWEQQDADDAIQDQIDAIEDQKEQAGNAIDDQIAKLEELKDKYNEVMGLIGMEWDEYQAMLKAQAEAAGMTFDEMEANLGQYKDAVIQNMKDVDEVTDTQEQIEGLRNFIDTLKEVWSVIATIIEIIDILTGGTGLMGALKDFVGNIFGGGSSDEEGGESGGNTFSNIVENAKGFFKNVGEAFKTGFDNLTTGISDFFSGAWTKVQGFFTNTGTGISGFLEKVKGFFSNGWTNISGGVQNFIKNLGGIFQNGFPGILETAANFIQNLLGSFTGGFGNIISSITGFLGNAGSSILSFVGNLGTTLSGGLGTIFSGIASAVGSLGTSITSALGGIGSAVSSALGGLGVGGALAGAATVGGIAAGGLALGGVVNSVTSSMQESDNGFIRWVGTGLKLAGGPSTWFWDLFKKKASGSKKIPKSSFYNVDELGPELLVRKAPQGRYTYLEAGDGVVPADMTKNLFDIGTDPEEWFRKQLGQYTIPSGSSSNSTILTIGDININQPVGNTDQLARAIKQELPNKMKQELSKR